MVMAVSGCDDWRNILVTLIMQTCGCEANRKRRNLSVIACLQHLTDRPSTDDVSVLYRPKCGGSSWITRQSKHSKNRSLNCGDDRTHLTWARTLCKTLCAERKRPPLRLPVRPRLHSSLHSKLTLDRSLR